MVDLAAELAEHSLTLKRTLVAIGWGALVGLVLALGAVAVQSGVRSVTLEAALFYLVVMGVGAAVLAVPLAALALAALRRAGPGRWPRVVMGAVVGAVLGLAEQLLFTHMAPWDFVRTEWPLALLLYAVPVAAGAAGGALVGPRPAARPESPGPDERAEDALLGG